MAFKVRRITNRPSISPKHLLAERWRQKFGKAGKWEAGQLSGLQDALEVEPCARACMNTQAFREHRRSLADGGDDQGLHGACAAPDGDSGQNENADGDPEKARVSLIFGSLHRLLDLCDDVGPLLPTDAHMRLSLLMMALSAQELTVLSAYSSPSLEGLRKESLSKMKKYSAKCIGHGGRRRVTRFRQAALRRFKKFFRCMRRFSPVMDPISEEEREAKLLAEVRLAEVAISTCTAALEVLQSVLKHDVVIPGDLVEAVIEAVAMARHARKQQIISDPRLRGLIVELQNQASYSCIFHPPGAAKVELVRRTLEEEYQTINEILTPFLLDVHKAAEGALQSGLLPGSQPVQTLSLQDGAAADQTTQAGGGTLDSTSSTPGGAQGPLLSTLLGDSSAPTPSAPVPDSQAHHHTGDGSTLDLLAGMSLGTTTSMHPAPPPTSSPSYPVSVGQVALPTSSSSGTSLQAPSSLLGSLGSQLPHAPHPDHSQTSLGLSSLSADLHPRGPFFGAPLGTPLPSEADTEAGGAPLRGPFRGHALGMPPQSEAATQIQGTSLQGLFSGPAFAVPLLSGAAPSPPTSEEGAVGSVQSSLSGVSPTGATGGSLQDDGHQGAQ
ncbi:hypothetical protein cyc_03838 [Cyclospora cayetanensis]|uniref:Uncharacterized protein n=1 Tax=Cyclospora cayetanensis TaxID=88456 RepID=A0A1D3D9D3_9EIME|nr:hypothetical protein cyc_03838 [Cyclospora cayetanensis]